MAFLTELHGALCETLPAKQAGQRYTQRNSARTSFMKARSLRFAFAYARATQRTAVGVLIPVAQFEPESVAQIEVEYSGFRMK